MDNLLLEVSKRDLEFQTEKGIISANRLWKFNLTDLNTVAVSINKQIKETPSESFIDTKPNKGLKELNLKLEFVKLIISHKINADRKAAIRKERQEWLDLLADKEEQKKQTMSAKAIQAQIAKLDADLDDDDDE